MCALLQLSVYCSPPIAKISAILFVICVLECVCWVVSCVSVQVWVWVWLFQSPSFPSALSLLLPLLLFMMWFSNCIWHACQFLVLSLHLAFAVIVLVSYCWLLLLIGILSFMTQTHTQTIGNTNAYTIDLNAVVLNWMQNMRENETTTCVCDIVECIFYTENINEYTQNFMWNPTRG